MFIQISDGCEVNSIEGTTIISANKTIAVTFSSDSTSPDVFFDCRLHKQDFKICKCN